MKGSMLSRLPGIILVTLAAYAVFPVLRGGLEILLSPRRDVLLLLILLVLIGLEVRRCLRFFE